MNRTEIILMVLGAGGISSILKEYWNNEIILKAYKYTDEYLALINKHSPDILVLDIDEADLLEKIIKTIRMQDQYRELVILVGVKNIKRIEDYISLEVRDYMLAPYEKSEVVFRIKNAIEYVRMFKELKCNNSKLNSMIENIPFSIYFKSLEGILLNANRGFLEYFNVTEEQAIGCKMEEIISRKGFGLLHNDQEVIALKKHMIFEIYTDEDDKVIEIHKVPVFDKLKEVIGIVGLVRDITDIKKNQEEMSKLFYKDSLTELANRRRFDETHMLKFQIKKDLQGAMKNNEIILYYQPQYTTYGVLKGFEALFRWNNIKYNKVPTINIIKVLESSGMIEGVGDYIIKQAFLFAKKINKRQVNKEPLVVFVNISPIQIMKDDFVEKIQAIIEEVGVLPEYVGIEITETVLLEDTEENVEKVRRLRQLGIAIALDDFGTGYSSFNYLVKFPLSQIKIDRSFIQSMNKGKEYIKLVRLIVDTAHSINLPLVAEGVETEKELDILKTMDVECIQGYLFSQPISALEAEKLI